MKRIVMMKGGVETLEYFSFELEKRLLELGYQVYFYDLKDEKKSARTLRKFIRVGETALVTFNFEGLEKEEGVYSEREGYVWDAYGIPCYNIAADHPYFYHDRLFDLPKKYYHISIDRYHQQYFREFYPEYKEIGFLPLAGTKFSNDDSKVYPKMQRTQDVINVNNDDMPEQKSRPIDVIFTGNYTELSFFEPYINWINDEYAEFYRGIINELIDSCDETVEAAALRHCEREMGKVPYDQLRGAFHKMIFIDLYIRNYWRGMAVKTLVDAGIKVDVVGKGWEKLEVLHPEHLILHPQTDSKTCLEMIGQAKISLNVMPWFKDGAHDRVFNSVLNGAVCVSDTSQYLWEELKEGEGICYFKLAELEKLPEKVKTLLADAELRTKIVQAGENVIKEKHTWANRADVLAEWIESACNLKAISV